MLERGPLVEAVARALSAGERVLVRGERGSGRTTLVRTVATEVARGSALRLVDVPRFPLDTAVRGEPLQDALLVVEEVQWADPVTAGELAALPGPVLLTGLPQTDLPDVTLVELPPLSDDEARCVRPDLSDQDLRRAGGNLRLLTTLVPGQVPSGPAARTLRGLWEELTEQERQDALLSGLSPWHPARPRIGALGELALALADADAIRAGHERLADSLTDPGQRAPHLYALGRDAEGAAEAVRAARAEVDPSRAAELLELVADLDPELQDLLAGALWRSWELERLLARFPQPGTPFQSGVVLKACTTLGRPWPGEAPAGPRARASFADGVLAERADDADGRIAVAASELARGGAPVVDLVPEDEEQAWQLAALATLDAWWRREPLPAASVPGPRFSVLHELLLAALETEREGASAERAERLASLLAVLPAPVPAWGHAALAVCQADLGNAQEAAAALSAAEPRSATDTQVLALARAEVELATGRPRVALRALRGAAWWPVLEPVAHALEAWALHEVGEGSLDGSIDWEGLSARRGRLQRWARSESTADVPALRLLEQEAQDAGWLPLLARVRESLRRRGEKVARTATAAGAAGALSAREVEVLGLVRDGLTSAQIATRLGVAQSTVETQVASAMRKLGARTRRHAVALLAGAQA